VLLHNVFAASLSAYMVYESCLAFHQQYDLKSLLTGDRWNHRLDGIDGDRASWGSVAAHRLASILFVHYIMKMYELVDTFIMIFKQNWRQVSFLHVYHHASGKPLAPRVEACSAFARSADFNRSPLLTTARANLCAFAVIFPTWYFNVLYYPGAEAWFCCFLNSLVHVVMYSYYGFLAVGISMPFVKPLLTGMQIVQFCLYLWQSGTMLAFGPEHSGKPSIAAWQLVVQATIFLFLFSQFFYKTYIQGSPRAPKQKAA
jgi:elongation of very long chain fatty acids protein 4